MLAPPLPPSSSISLDPRAAGLLDERSMKDSMTFWNLVERLQHAADRASTHSSGRGDHLPATSWSSGAGCSKRSWTWPVLGTLVRR